MPPRVRPDFTAPMAVPPAMSTFPSGTFKKTGFGLNAMTRRDWEKRLEGTRVVFDILVSGEMPRPSAALLERVATVKDMFAAVAVGAANDWFTISKYLGHPSAELSRKAAASIHELHTATTLKDTARFSRASSFLTDEPIVEMLENYRASTAEGQQPQDEIEWAFLLWSSSWRDTLVAGSCDGTIEEAAAEVSAENPDFDPYGVVAAWLVHDTERAFQDIDRVLTEFLVRDDGIYRIDPGEAKAKIDALLAATDNIVMSPWHVDAAPPNAAPTPTTTPTSTSTSKPKPKPKAKTQK